MKLAIPPAYHPVVFRDASASHLFWTGKARVLDSEGRVERFHRRYGRPAEKATP